MPKRYGKAAWEGTLQKGRGLIEVESGLFKANYDFKTRFENQKGTNPEELIGAAHAGCFSMAFSMLLEQAGHAPKTIATKAEVLIEKDGEGFTITKIGLLTIAEVPGIADDEFQKIAIAAKDNCPVSKALAGVNEITLKAELKEG